MDTTLGYRICTFNDRFHGGTHVHAPPPDPAVHSIAFIDGWEAEAFMRQYAARHDRWDLASLEKEVNDWRSASNAP